MKSFLRKLFSPILSYYESGNKQYSYKASHRTILMVFGVLCLFLSFVSGYISYTFGEIVGAIPCLVFFSIGAVCEIIGTLGTDKAVARVWGNK